MRQLIRQSTRNRVLKAALSTGFMLAFASQAFAGPRKPVQVYAAGSITNQYFCSATEVCQEATVTGTATQLGRFTGVLFERVDVTAGTYTGSAVFTTADGSSIKTEYTGVVTPPDEKGRVFFFEDHDVVGGTGQYATATGDLRVLGTADAAGKIQIVGSGSLAK
jgi:hypothetical protein